MHESNRYLKDGKLDEIKMLTDADHISDGACNPIAISRSLYEMTHALYKADFGSDSIKQHPAIRATLDHLFLVVFGYNGTTDNVYTQLWDKIEELSMQVKDV